MPGGAVPSPDSTNHPLVNTWLENQNHRTSPVPCVGQCPPAPSPWTVGGERGGDVPCGFLQPSADDGDMNALFEQVVNEAMPALHHRHAFHQVAQALIGYVAPRSRLDQGQVKFDPLPLIQQTLIVQFKGFIV